MSTTEANGWHTVDVRAALAADRPDGPDAPGEVMAVNLALPRSPARLAAAAINAIKENVTAPAPAPVDVLVVFHHLPALTWWWRQLDWLGRRKRVATGPAADRLAAALCARLRSSRVAAPARLRLLVTARWEPWRSVPPLEYLWPARLGRWRAQREALQHIALYYSTIGGAFAAIGRRSRSHARRAGLLALQQSRVASRLGDDALAASCRLYFAESLLHLGNADGARAIVDTQRVQYGHLPSVAALCTALTVRLERARSLPAA